MITQYYAKNLSDNIELLMNELSDDIKNVRKKSKMKVINHDNHEATSDPFSVDHVPQKNEAVIFMELLADEALLCDLDTMDKGMDELRDVLKQHLMNEQKVLTLVEHLRHCARDESIKCLLLQLVPCISHLEKRVHLKLFTILIEDGLSEYVCIVHENANGISSEKERIKLFTALVKKEIKTKILGGMCLPCQFKTLIETNTKSNKSQIGTISLENAKVRNAMKNLRNIIDICLSDNDNKTKYYPLQMITMMLRLFCTKKI